MKLKLIISILVIFLLSFGIGCGSSPAEPPSPNPPIEGEEQKDEVFKKEMLFDDIDGTYNYCASVMQVDDKTKYIYYCANKDYRVIVDYLICRKGELNINGEWVWSPKSIVLQPTPNTWDSRHTCDPSVIAGEFNYNGETYNYLMAYLGCVTSNNQENEVGIALAKNPQGPFIKVKEVNPIAKYTRDTSPENNNKFQWGYGQPSLISADKKGEVLLFYTAGTAVGTYTVVERWNLSDLGNPVKLSTAKITTRGLTNLNGNSDFMNNADFAYDPKEKRIYVVSDCHPNPEDDEPYIISSKYRLTYLKDKGEKVGGVFDSQTGASWVIGEVVGKAQTGFERNHNVGILTDQFGWLRRNDYVESVYTMSELGSGNLWTYRLYPHRTQIVDNKN